MTKLEFGELYKKYQQKFGQNDQDIYISAYPKSGQTWLQMILYQLTTDGDMNFQHINEVSPWLFYLTLHKKTITDFPTPRIIKSHDCYQHFPKRTKGKFIHLLRDGKDVILSSYYFLKNFFGYPNSFEEHFQWFIGEDIALRGLDKIRREYLWHNWFVHNQIWIKNSKNLPILYIRYEDLHKDIEKCVIAISEFCDIRLTPSILERVKERSSFEYMKKHESKFGPLSGNNKEFIRKGRIGEGRKTLSYEQIKMYEIKFKETLGHLPWPSVSN